MEGKYVPIHRRLPIFFDRPPAIGLSFSLNTYSLRGCPTKLADVSSLGLDFSTAQRLIFMAVFRSRFSN
jgi:hypothetical protein